SDDGAGLPLWHSAYWHKCELESIAPYANEPSFVETIGLRRCSSAARSSARPSSKVSESETVGQPKRSKRTCRHAWRFTSGCKRRSRPLSASRSNAQRWMAPGRVQRPCSQAKFGRAKREIGTAAYGPPLKITLRLKSHMMISAQLR